MLIGSATIFALPGRERLQEFEKLLGGELGLIEDRLQRSSVEFAVQWHRRNEYAALHEDVIAFLPPDFESGALQRLDTLTS